MSAQVRRYKQGCPDETAISNLLPGGATVTAFTLYAPSIMDAALSDDAAAEDLDGILAADHCWILQDVDPVAGAAKTRVQSVAAVLAADASAIATASGWTDVLSIDLTTKGGTTAGVLVAAIASSGILGEGQARLIVNGGAFSNVVLGATYHALAMTTTKSRDTAAFHVPVSIPSTSGTTYTFTLQMQATGLLNSMTPRKGCALTCAEHL